MQCEHRSPDLAAGCLGRPRSFVDEVQRQLQSFRRLGGDDAQPALGTGCSAGINLESQGFGVFRPPVEAQRLASLDRRRSSQRLAVFNPDTD
jgi:hypothetical protein